MSEENPGGFELDFDPLDSEQHWQEIALPVDPEGKSRAVYHVTVQDIPKGKYGSLLGALAAAWGTLSKVYGASADLLDESPPAKNVQSFEKILAEGELIVASSDAQGKASEMLARAHRELVRWGIRDHRAEDFRTPKQKNGPKTPTPFQPGYMTWEGEKYQGAHDKMLRLYERLKILGQLAQAVQDFQDGRIRAPEEFWEAAEKARKEEEEKKAAEEKSRKEGDKAPLESQKEGPSP